MNTTVTNGVYTPTLDHARHAPAAVCSVASRLLQLRKAIKTNPPDMRELERLINTPIAYEAEFLSGDITRVHDAIQTLGKQSTP